ncbi:uncharacterized protein LOC107267508 isoform X2 [Cephus cinctus]|uniref:Uncharacterized protein LOC107267508 isoform X2 n=1 Tax=Cephus cinctus TaxID=211228 RepID=A0AAJ7W143_CEPCN|nr:uncharacterized protein LOC107267508 isoform X2 [Cephus cinctus]
MDNQSGKIQRAIICLLLLVGGATGLKDVKIKVPDMVRSGDDALLSCNYDLESASLYAIKWYRGDVEFYRYLPKEAPSHTVFPVQGIKVDISKSDNHDVTLVNVSRELTGRYKCEVSADAPSFHTAIKEAPMEVVDVPETNPTIVAERQRLPAGETLRANCTSGPSRPAPVIKWTLNGNHTRADVVIQFCPRLTD